MQNVSLLVLSMIIKKNVSNVTAHGVGCFNRAVEPLRFLPSWPAETGAYGACLWPSLTGQRQKLTRHPSFAHPSGTTGRANVLIHWFNASLSPRFINLTVPHISCGSVVQQGIMRTVREEVSIENTKTGKLTDYHWFEGPGAGKSEKGAISANRQDSMLSEFRMPRCCRTVPRLRLNCLILYLYLIHLPYLFWICDATVRQGLWTTRRSISMDLLQLGCLELLHWLLNESNQP